MIPVHLLMIIASDLKQVVHKVLLKAISFEHGPSDTVDIPGHR